MSVHPSLEAKEDALLYIESLILKLLTVLLFSCGSTPLHSIQDVEDRVRKSFPNPMDKWALSRANSVIFDLGYHSNQSILSSNASSLITSSTSFTTSSNKFKKRLHINSSTSLIPSLSQQQSNQLQSKEVLLLPLDKIHSHLKDILGYKIDIIVSTFITALLEYIAVDILKLSGNYVINLRNNEITSQDIKVAMCADKVLMDLFYGNENDEVSGDKDDDNLFFDMFASSSDLKDSVDDSEMKYEDVIKEFLYEERSFLRDLNLVIKVFKEPFNKLSRKNDSLNNYNSSTPSTPTTPTINRDPSNSAPSSPSHITKSQPVLITEKDVEVIFSNIIDIFEFSASLLSSVEDALEVGGSSSGEGSSSSAIGICFEEMSELYEFDVFEKFSEDVLSGHPVERLNKLLSEPGLLHSFSSGNLSSFIN